MVRLAVTYGVLRRLGFSEERVEECLRSIGGVDLDEAFDWVRQYMLMLRYLSLRRHVATLALHRRGAGHRKGYVPDPPCFHHSRRTLMAHRYPQRRWFKFQVNQYAFHSSDNAASTACSQPACQPTIIPTSDTKQGGVFTPSGR